jgi:hypothetical protein
VLARDGVPDGGRWRRISDAFARDVVRRILALRRSARSHCALASTERARRLARDVEAVAAGTDFAASRARTITRPGLQAAALANDATGAPCACCGASHRRSTTPAGAGFSSRSSATSSVRPRGGPRQAGDRGGTSASVANRVTTSRWPPASSATERCIVWPSNFASIVYRPGSSATNSHGPSRLAVITTLPEPSVIVTSTPAR